MRTPSFIIFVLSFSAALLAASALPSPVTAQQQQDSGNSGEVGGEANDGPCPVPTEEARKLAHRFFETPEFAKNRRAAGVTDLKPEQVQTLEGEPPSAALRGSGEAAGVAVEPEVCRTLNEKYSDEINSEDAPHQPHYFKVGDRYVVILEETKPEKYGDDIIAVGLKTTLIVLDENLDEIDSWWG